MWSDEQFLTFVLYSHSRVNAQTERLTMILKMITQYIPRSDTLSFSKLSSLMSIVFHEVSD